MHFDYVTYIIIALFVVIGAGLFRVGLMNLKSESSGAARNARPYIAFGSAAVLIFALRVVKIGG